MYQDMTYHDVRADVERVIAPGKFAKAEVFLARSCGLRFIAKDFGGKGFFERNVIGRLVIAREHRAYRALAGVEGLPAHVRRITPFCLIIEYLDGNDLGGVAGGAPGPETIRQLESIIDTLHGRGWVHLDLQRRSNILLVNGRVHVVDLASAVHPGGVPLIGRLLVRLLGFADRLSLVKMKRLFAPGLLTERDRRLIRLRNLVMRSQW